MRHNVIREGSQNMKKFTIEGAGIILKANGWCSFEELNDLVRLASDGKYALEEKNVYTISQAQETIKAKLYDLEHTGKLYDELQIVKTEMRRAEEVAKSFNTLEQEHNKIVNYLSPFESLVSGLLYFIGCSEKEFDHSIEYVENAREDICCRVKKYYDTLAKLEEDEIKMVEIPSFEEIPMDDQTYQEIELVREIQKYIEDGEDLLNQKAISERTVTRYSQIVDVFFTLRKTEIEKWYSELSEEKEKLQKYKRKYKENRKRFSNEKIQCEEAMLLQKMLPYIYEIAQTEETAAKDWYLVMGEKVRKAFDEAGKELPFLLVDENHSRYQDEEIRLDFLPGTASWPGLYYQEGDAVHCIFQGSIRRI